MSYVITASFNKFQQEEQSLWSHSDLLSHSLFLQNVLVFKHCISYDIVNQNKLAFLLYVLRGSPLSTKYYHFQIQYIKYEVDKCTSWVYFLIIIVCWLCTWLYKCRYYPTTRVKTGMMRTLSSTVVYSISASGVSINGLM